MSEIPEAAPLILIVDDDKFMRLQLRTVMQKDGYRVEEAEDGSQCLTAYTQLQPDMVLLDASMPVMDGFTCCRELQTLAGIEQVPILLITGLDDQDSVDLAFQSGATDYVTKPIHWAVLRQRVRRLLQQSAQAKQIQALIKELEKANQELKHLTNIDGLTQVANRRCFDEYIEQEWKRLAREKGSLSIIMVDIDFFKLYNDTYGHLGGDECLRSVARILSKVVKRPADLVARYGGEEFAVILPNTDLEGALKVAEAIQAQV
ncbi:MAG: diguanylate cyclase, partial [Leptolyngbyaceae bacterium]|nr:diguanylate cyclase [Leptolyngbyaceae bacterium]